MQNSPSAKLNASQLLVSTYGSVIFLKEQTLQVVKIEVLQDHAVRREAVHLKFRLSLLHLHFLNLNKLYLVKKP